jgi:effector-binding domain-containing protein
LKKVGFVFLLLLVAFVATGFLLPKQVHVERSISIDRPASMMFELLNSYRHFNDWSPWAKRDPNARFIISGPESGVGARMSWIGEPQLVGTGWQQIVASKPYERIDIELDFDAQGVANTGFLLVSQENTTKVTWFFDSDLTKGVGIVDSFLARYFGLLFDRWVGGDYELGLANLKQFAESLPIVESNTLDIERVDVVGQQVLYVTSSSGRDPVDIALAMTEAYSEISQFMRLNGLSMSGQPMAITRSWEGGEYQFDAAIPVDHVPPELSGNIKSGLSPSGIAVRAVHHGAYAQMMPTYTKLSAYISAHGLQQGGVSWEHYVSDPGETDATDTITHVYIMLESSAGIL